jgi:phosphocarrier protein
MKNITLHIVNKLGLHARASAKLVATTSKYLSKIDILHGNNNVNGKSIMGVMMLGAKFGSTINCIIDGPDELEVSQALQHLVENKFHEES